MKIPRHILLSTAGAPATPDLAGTSESFRSSPWAWALAGVLALVALYFLIRLLEWDLINKDTEDQDDPLG